MQSGLARAAVFAACCDCVNLLTMSGVLGSGQARSPARSAARAASGSITLSTTTSFRHGTEPARRPQPAARVGVVLQPAHPRPRPATPHPVTKSPRTRRHRDHATRPDSALRPAQTNLTHAHRHGLDANDKGPPN